MTKLSWFAFLFLSLPLWAQQNSTPELHYQSIRNFLKLPPQISIGPDPGITVNSKGHIFLFNRGDYPLLEFDANGNYLRKITYGTWDFVFAHSLRVDSEDNIWAVDEGINQVVKLSPEGKVLLVLGNKADIVDTPPPGEPLSKLTRLFNRPTDVAFGPSGDIFVSDGYGNARVVKYDKNGKFQKVWGRLGTAPGEFHTPHSIVVDAKGLVYVADRVNKRIQVFDSDGNFMTKWDRIGSSTGLTPTALCITPGPDQVIFMTDGGVNRILKLDLNGNVLGALGKPGTALGQFADPHGIACPTQHELYVGETVNARVQKLILGDAH
jgi:DNA-binding beta-propeller fold protein YncE